MLLNRHDDKYIILNWGYFSYCVRQGVCILNIIKYIDERSKYHNVQNLYDLVIISPSLFFNELQNLSVHKNNFNIKTFIKTTEEIYREYSGRDNAEQIKYFIKDAIENWGIKYLLLIGAGTEENELFPVRYAWIPSGNYEKNFPSDLYYSDIYNSEGEFSSWDNNSNGKYAEITGIYNDMDKVDMYPDVYLGKLPCNNEAEVKTIVDKIINYEH